MCSSGAGCHHGSSRCTALKCSFLQRLLALNSLILCSKLVKECITSLVIASSFFHIRLVCVPGHSGICENCKVDELARERTLITISSHWKRVGLLMSSCDLALDL